MSNPTHAPVEASPEYARTIDERAHWCFGCGPGNPQGLHLHFEVEGTDPGPITASSTVTLTRFHEGPPGHIHGGIVAVLMDEAMSKLHRPLNLIAMTRNMEVDYLRPAPLYMPLRLTATHLRRDGRKLFHQAELAHPDGTVLARAKGFFLAIEPHVLAAIEAANNQLPADEIA